MLIYRIYSKILYGGTFCATDPPDYSHNME